MSTPEKRLEQILEQRALEAARTARARRRELAASRPSLPAAPTTPGLKPRLPPGLPGVRIPPSPQLQPLPGRTPAALSRPPAAIPAQLRVPGQLKLPEETPETRAFPEEREALLESEGGEPEPSLLATPSAQQEAEPLESPQPRPTVPELARPILEEGEAAVDRFHCPVCGMMADLVRLDNAPYKVDLWVQIYGGKVKPGTKRVTASGKLIDRTRNTRGSIEYVRAGTPQEADIISRIIRSICAEVVHIADSGQLIQM